MTTVMPVALLAKEITRRPLISRWVLKAIQGGLPIGGSGTFRGFPSGESQSFKTQLFKIQLKAALEAIAQ